MRSKGWTTCKRYTLPPHSTNPTDANGGVRFIFTLIRLTATAGSNYEITGNRWRWPRTRFGLAPGAVPSHSNRLCRSGQRRHRQLAAHQERGVQDRKSDAEGKSVHVRVDLGGRCTTKHKKNKKKIIL